MESHTLHMISVKALLLAVLAMTATACGIKVNDDGEDEQANGDGKDDYSPHHGGAKNELILITEGSYGVELSSTDVTCDKKLDGATSVVRFKAAEGTDDAGLDIQIQVTGSFAAGDALTPDNSDYGRHFDLMLWTPAHDFYSYSSNVGTDARKVDYAALTILKSTDYVTAGRVWIENLRSKADDGAGAARAISLRGSFECADW